MKVLTGSPGVCVRAQNEGTYLIVQALVVKGDIEGKSGGVVMWPQGGLFIWPVANHEVHDCPGLQGATEQRLKGS